MAEAIPGGFLEGDDGEAKCEIMVASSGGKVRHCDLTSHCSLLLLLGRYDWGASPLLFCIVIWCLTRSPGCHMSHMSVRGST